LALTLSALQRHNHEGHIYQYGGDVITQSTLSLGMVLRTDKLSPQITVFSTSLSELACGNVDIMSPIILYELQF